MKLQSLRTRQFLTLVAMAALLLFAVLAAALPSTRNGVIRRTTIQLETAADLKTLQVQHWLSEGERAAQLIVNLQEVREEVPQFLNSSDVDNRARAQDELLAEIGAIIDTHAAVYSISLLHATSGQVLLSTDPTLLGRERKNEAYFSNGREALFVSPVAYSVGREAPVLTIGAPMWSDAGSLLAVMAVEMNMAELGAMLDDSAGLGSSGRAYLVGGSGFYVTTPQGVEAPPLGVIVESEGVRRALIGESGSDIYTDPTGTPVLGVYRWLPVGNIALLVESDEADLVAQITRTFSIIILINIGLLLLAILLARYLTNWMMVPLEQIVTAARALQAGDLSRRAPAAGADEVGQLANAFNDMAASLQRSYTHLEEQVAQRASELHENQAKLIRAQEIARMGSWEWDIVTNEIHWSAELYRIYGFSPEKPLTRKAILGAIHPGDREIYRTAFEDAHAGHPPKNVDFRIRRPDGEERYIQAVVQVTFDEDGNAVRMAGTGQDRSEQKRRDRERETILVVTAALRGTKTRDDLPPVVLDQMLDLFDAEGAALAVRDPQSGETVIELGRGAWYYWSGERLAPGEGLAGHVIESGEPYLNNDMQVDSLFARPDLLGGMSAVTCVPLIAQGQTLGAMWLGRQSEFSADEVRLLVAVGDVAASALHRATLHEQTEISLAETQALYQMARTLNASTEMSDLLQAVVEGAVDALPAAGVMLSTVDQKEGTITDFAVSGPASEAPGIIYFTEFQDTLNGWVMREMQPALSPKGAPDPRESLTVQRCRRAAKAGASLVVPLQYRGYSLGTLAAINHADQRDFTERDVALLQAIANQASIAIENARLFKAAEQRLDELTILVESSAAMSTTLETDTLTEIMTRIITKAMGVESCTISIWDRDQDAVIILLDFQHDESDRVSWKTEPHGTFYALADFPATRRVLTEREPLLVRRSDPQADPAELAWLQEWDINSTLMMPLVVRDEVIGLLELMSDDENKTYGSTELGLCQTLANQMAAALENARLFEEAQQRLREQSILLETSTTLLSTLDLNEVLQILVTRIGEAINAPSAGIELWDEAEDTMTVIAGYNTSESTEVDQMAADVGKTYRLSDYGGAAQALRTLAPVVINANDTSADRNEVALLNEYGFQSVLIVPLVAKARAFGIVELYETRVEPTFTPQEIELTQALTNVAAMAIENARLYEAERAQLLLARTLQEMGVLLTSELKLDEVLDTIFDLLGRLVDYDSCSIQLINADGKLELTAGRGYQDLVAARQTVHEISDMTLQRFRATRGAVVIADTQADKRWELDPRMGNIHSWAGAPLLVKERLIGTLNVDSHTVNVFHDSVKDTLLAFANQAAIAIENARLYEAEARRVRDLHFLNEITQSALQTSDFSEMLDTLADRLGRLTEADGCFITLWDAAEQRTLPAAAYGAEHDAFTQLQLQPGEVTLTQSVLQAERPIVVESVHNSPYLSEFVRSNSLSKSLLGLPLIAAGQKLGAAIISFEEPHKFSAHEIARAEQGTGQMALAMARAQLLENLHSARREAEAANHAKSDFLANTSHELRTPLNGIVGFLQILQNDLEESPAERQEFIQLALESSNLLLILINDILDLAKIEAGHFEVHVEAAPLDKVLEEVQRLTSVQAKDKGLELNFENRTELCVQADPARLRQVLLNLVGNAIKFTLAGEVNVRVRQIDDPGYALIEVQDTGIGIPSDVLPRVFDKFEQGNGVVAATRGGTGLGLSISRSLVEMMGGEIDLESEGEGCGTRALLKLPLAEDI